MKNIALFSSAFIIIPAGRDVIFPTTPIPGMDDGKMLQLMNPSGKGKEKKSKLFAFQFNSDSSHLFSLLQLSKKQRRERCFGAYGALITCFFPC